MVDTEQSEAFIFIWKIVNYNFNTVKYNECLKSPEFEVKAFKGTSWYLEFYPRGNKNPGNLNSCCYLRRTLFGAEKINITFKIELIGKDGNFLADTDNITRTFTNENNFGCVWNKCFNDVNDSNMNTITVRCLLSRSESGTGLTTICKARTEIWINQYSFQWKVKMLNDSSWTESKRFTFSQAEHVEVTLTAPNDIVNVNVKKVTPKNFSPHIIGCKLSLLDVKGVACDSNWCAHSFNPLDNVWEFRRFIDKSKLMCEKNKYIKDNSFMLIFEFSVSNGKIFQDIEGYFFEESYGKKDFYTVATIGALHEDLQRMYNNRLQTDVNIRAESQTFQTHKLFLSARSPVFAAMFEQDMLENQTGIVEIPDVEAKILDSFLRFLYTGIVENLDCESALKLLLAANKYQVSSLEEMCSSYLMSNLTTDNACDVILIADMVGQETLKAYTVDYIRTHAETILPSSQWAQLIQNNIKLATDVFCKVSAKFGAKY